MNWRRPTHPPDTAGQDILEQVGRSLGADPQEVADALYADLPDQQTLVSFEAPDLQVLLDRFNLAQAQGLLYRAYSLIITARRNEPARYKQLICLRQVLRADGHGGGRLGLRLHPDAGRPDQSCLAAPPATA